MAQTSKKAPVEKESASSELARKFKTNPALFIGTVVVLVLVIVSFVLVPAIVPESTRGGGDLTFGYYDKVPISYVPGNYLADTQEQFARYYQSVIENFDIGTMREYIWRPAFNRTVVHTAILQEMKRSNFSVPEKTVNRNVALLPQFQENGRFSAALYNQMSDTNRLVLWRQKQDELMKDQYFSDLFNLLIPAGEAAFVSGMASDMRTFDGVIFNVEDFPASEYLAFAEENPDLFDSIHLSRIIVNSSEKEAKKILESIKNGTTTFEEAAKSQSQDKSSSDRGGDMGTRYVYDLEREILDEGDREKIFSLGRGELSDVIRILDMWGFFRVEEELIKADFNDDAVMNTVRSYVRNWARARMENWAEAQANNFIAEVKESGFDNAVRWQNKEKFSLGPLFINYGNIDLFAANESFSIPGLSGQELSDLSRNEKFWKSAFFTDIQTPSKPVIQGNKVFVFFPTEQIKAEEDKIKEIEYKYTSEWVDNITDQSLIPYFLNSKKMVDHFQETYDRIFRSTGS